ncbi:LacI family DNA-binding transcriptional regulator [Acidipropionibacterium virtanenii]|uniref:LacI family DNA-binding transcriptional regulator n=1 Tax=Acidipropionibacterium virtanenii TaxID=2057246 RepID=UPI001FE69059|nr:substrate-binding domain-containing protein [Acidipropionibacterium virtanenii]
MAHDLGYVVNRAASDLKRNEQSGIAVITASTVNSYYIDMVQGIHAELRGSRHTAMVTDIAAEGHFTQAAEDLTIQSILGARPAAVISTLPLSTDNLDLLRRWDVPVVFVDSPPPAGVQDAASVTTDNVRASEDLGAHLGIHGYRTWLALMYPGRWTTRSPREAGLRAAAQQVGAVLHVAESDNDPKSAAANLNVYLQRNPLPDALIAGNAPMLQGIMQCLADHHILIPDDVAVVAFDDFAWAGLLKPPMTVVDEDADAIGRRAAELALDLIDRQPATGRVKGGVTGPIYTPADRLITQATLRIRESCGCPSRR